MRGSTHTLGDTSREIHALRHSLHSYGTRGWWRISYDQGRGVWSVSDVMGMVLVLSRRWMHGGRSRARMRLDDRRYITH